MTTPRPLGGLVARLDAEGFLAGYGDGQGVVVGLPVLGVAYDSRLVGPGTLFVAIPGFHADGHDFVPAAAAAGAVAAIVEHPVAGAGIPQLVVRSARTALSRAASWWYDDPARGLLVVGVTGTDGKTTTCFLTAAALDAAGLATGMIGTVETRIGGERTRHAAHVTTPEALEVHATLAAMATAGDVAAVVETTSHALELERVADVAYDAAILTNLTHEHLEFHGSFEAYRAAKLKLFEGLRPGPRNPGKTIAGRPWPKVAVVNVDDPAASWFTGTARAAGAAIVGYGTGPGADVRATHVEDGAHRLRVDYAAPSGPASIALRLAGRFNVHNALAVVALGEALGLPPGAVRAGLEGVGGVPGRMDRIDLGQPFGVIVDYAHSPASLQIVLELLAPVAASRGGGLIAVFGSGGERDTAKRSLMGRVAGERCRLVVATDEDPRGEDRHAIIEAIVRGAEEAGARRGVDVLAVPDRREAIGAAFEQARPGDIVLLAGKGHEPTILYADHAQPWDEAGVARELLAAMGYRGDAG